MLVCTMCLEKRAVLSVRAVGRLLAAWVPSGNIQNASRIPLVLLQTELTNDLVWGFWLVLCCLCLRLFGLVCWLALTHSDSLGLTLTRSDSLGSECRASDSRCILISLFGSWSVRSMGACFVSVQHFRCASWSVCALLRRWLVPVLYVGLVLSYLLCAIVFERSGAKLCSPIPLHSPSPLSNKIH
jgi:hypothetical protein